MSFTDSYRVMAYSHFFEKGYRGEVHLYGRPYARCEHEHEDWEEAMHCGMALRLTLPVDPPAPPKPMLIIRVDGEFGDEFIDGMAPSYSRLYADWEDDRLEDGVLG
jgi:hypothetical protein